MDAVAATHHNTVQARSARAVLASPRERGLIESLLLAVTRVTTVLNKKEKTNATGFFFEREGRLYLVTARHVLRDEASDHHPDGILIELHIDPDNVVEATRFMIPLFRDGKSVWREGVDSAGEVDVAVIQLDRAALPPTLSMKAFTPGHLVRQFDEIEVGTSILIVGFPLGFQDTLHHLPVARAGDHRHFLRPALPGRRLFPDRRADASRRERRAGRGARDDRTIRPGGPVLAVARSPYVAHGRGQPRRGRG